MQLIECVPNISEGKNPAVISAVCDAVRQGGAALLHCDCNADANRTVLTFAGAPEQVAASAFNCLRAACARIDMRTHHGAHPRLGAVDVCPLIPVRGITLEETAVWADQLARRAAAELALPVYLYETNAASDARKNLADIRRGEYESLPQKLRAFPPDYGPAEFSPSVQKTGASVIGARHFLLAFNVSLNTRDTAPAKQIAAALREKNGGLKTVKAIGWYMPGYGCAQVSFNLTDYHTAGLAQAFEACQKEAAKYGLEVTGSELIGLAPEEALLNAGRFYAPAQTDSAVLLETAVRALGLHRHGPFHPQEKILEYRLHAERF